MRLAATLTTVREATRRPMALRGTLRDPDDAPCDVVILDASLSGFLAEFPDGLIMEPGTRVRVAATPLRAREAIVVRQDGRQHGLVFVRPLSPSALHALGADQPSNVTRLPVGPAALHPDGGDDRHAGRISARASLALMLGISVAQWLALLGVVTAISAYN